jgi:exodeoxyribonuclease X
MLIREATFNTFDTETTGKEASECGLVEIACVFSRLTGPALYWESLVDPGCPIPAEASGIHHLVDRDVAGKPKAQEVLAVMGSFRPFGDPIGCLAAHNVEFDWGVISRFIPDAETLYPNRLCTMRLARKLWPTMPNFKNQTLRYILGIDMPAGGDVHRALSDAKVTAAILRLELEEVLRRSKNPDEATVEDLIAWVEAPMLLPDPVPFGKHKDQPWSSVPRDYWDWCLKNMADLDKDRRHTIEFWRRGGR